MSPISYSVTLCKGRKACHGQTLYLSGHILKVTEKIKCCEYGPLVCIHNTSFSSKRTNGFNKLQCYITLGWKGLPEANALA
jgi:hypothetical protein